MGKDVPWVVTVGIVVRGGDIDCLIVIGTTGPGCCKAVKAKFKIISRNSVYAMR